MDAKIRATLDYFRLSDSTAPLRRIWLQGTLWHFICEGYYAEPPKHVKGSTIKGYSAKARLAAMEFANTVKWDVGTTPYFLTFTYPDECLPRSTEKMNRDRYQIHRAIERIKGRHIPLIWRKEWIARKTGVYAGQAQPHWHFIAFDFGFTPYKEIRVAWARICGVDYEPDMKFIPLENAQKAGYYVHKYTAKSSYQDKLGNLLNHNTGGRHAGYLRKSLIPRYSPTFTANLTHDQAMELTRMGAAVITKLRDNKPTSFSIFGPKMERFLAKIAQWGIATVPTP